MYTILIIYTILVVQNFCCVIFLAVAQCWCHGNNRSSECEIRIVVSVVVPTLLFPFAPFTFHLSIFTGLFESPKRGRELIAAHDGICRVCCSHRDLKIGVFMGYSRSIRGIFTGYSYVSVMCRLCIGYVSVIYRNILGVGRVSTI